MFAFLLSPALFFVVLPSRLFKVYGNTRQTPGKQSIYYNHGQNEKTRRQQLQSPPVRANETSRTSLSRCRRRRQKERSRSACLRAFSIFSLFCIYFLQGVLAKYPQNPTTQQSINPHTAPACFSARNIYRTIHPTPSFCCCCLVFATSTPGLVSALLLSSPFTPADRSSLHLPSQAQTCVPLHPTRTYIHAPKSQPINQPVFSLFLCFFCHDSGKVCLGLIASHNTHGAPDLVRVRGEKTPRVMFAILLPVTRQATKPIQYISTHHKY